MTHGMQKLFGVFGGKGVELMSLFGLAGVIELVVGLLVLVGFFARYAAVLGGVTMLVAYFYAHASNGWLPIVNKGELAIMYFAAFLVMVTHEDKTWSLEKMLMK